MSEEPELHTEERNFAALMLTGMDPEAAARASGIVEQDATPAFARRTAMQALGDSSVKAYIVDLFEEAQLSPLDLVKTIKRNLTVKKYALHQASGEKVEVGDDSMGQLTAVKLAGAWLGLERKEEPKSRTPDKWEIHFHNNEPPIEDEDEGDIDDEDVLEGEYSVPD